MHAIHIQNLSAQSTARIVRSALLMGVSAIAFCGLPTLAYAQETPPPAVAADAAPAATADQVGGGTSVAPAAEVEPDEIVVTGVRAALERARDIKRTSAGVVDAVSAEDIGKFPDTNLAESLQRIPGVSIERRAGEGKGVTVRGFGPSFNLVTVNGRQLSTSDVDTVGGDQNVDFGRATSRAFDFSNLASEGVSRLEVYKTGRASVPSGGIGAAINIVTARPLDGKQSGFRGSIGAKALYDTSLESFRVSPETSGVLSWSNPQDTIGFAVFGSYSARKSAAASSTVNEWNITPFRSMPGRDNDRLNNNDTIINNGPTNPDQLVAIPNDSRYHYSEFDRKRINGSATLQFKPIETLTITADTLFAQNKINEQRSDQTNWFNRPFDEVTFDGDPVVATAIYLKEGSRYGTKDIGFEQQYRATKSRLNSYGLNANWELAEGVTLNLDANTSTSKTTPDSKNGASSTLVSFGAPVVDAHSVDFSGPIPQQDWTLNDALGNRNGVLDIGDLGTQVQRTNASRQSHRINQFRADLGWDFGGGARFDVGATHIDSKMTSARTQTQQQLGDWGITNPGDVQAIAGDLIKQFCLECRFDKYQPTDASIAFRGNAVDLYQAFAAAYSADGNPLLPGIQPGNRITPTGSDYDEVEEKVSAIYSQLSWKGELGGRPVQVLGGLRWETTKVNAFAIVSPPTGIVWNADNDFSRPVNLSNVVEVSGKGSYTNILPSVDFRIEPMDNLVARVSVSKTLARPEYGNLFASPSANAPNRPTFLGGVATGTAGNPDLKPLVSTNLDFSLEYYYARSSYVSAGFFAKAVKNFVGTGTFDESLFGLRDPSSGAAGTRSGLALGALQGLNQTVDDVSLFTMTALLVQNGGNVAAATATFRANINPTTGAIDQTYANGILAAIDINAAANDPLFSFAVSRPINNRSGKIHGLELQGQHFFGDSGLGVAASLTKVMGDVKFDRGSNPGQNVFALLGLSDSANVTGIFEKYGFSARVGYNWRGKFLAQTNRGGSRNPVYYAPFGTLDASLGYDINKQMAVSFEVINLLSEPLRTYGRSTRQMWFAQELKPRFLLGARYRF